MLSLVLELLFTAEGQLDSCYCSRDPSQDRLQNVLFLLYHHLSHEANSALVPRLMLAAEITGPHAVLLLRVLCRQLFPASLYAPGRALARGAYAQVKPSLGPASSGACPLLCSLLRRVVRQVHAARAPGFCSEEVVMKLVDVPSSIHDQCRQVRSREQGPEHCDLTALDLTARVLSRSLMCSMR